MSIQAVSWVLSIPGTDLPGAPRLAMIALANHADHTDGYCWPSMKTIAAEAGLGLRTVKRVIPQLVDNGFIEVRKRRGAHGVAPGQSATGGTHIQKQESSGLEPSDPSLVSGPGDRAVEPPPDPAARPPAERGTTTHCRAQPDGRRAAVDARNVEAADIARSKQSLCRYCAARYPGKPGSSTGTRIRCTRP